MSEKDYERLLKINLNASYNLYDKKEAERLKLRLQDPKKDLRVIDDLINLYPMDEYPMLQTRYLIPYRDELIKITKTQQPNKMLA